MLSTLYHLGTLVSGCFYAFTEEKLSFQYVVLVLLLLIVYFSHSFIFCRIFLLNVLCVPKE